METGVANRDWFSINLSLAAAFLLFEASELLTSLLEGPCLSSEATKKGDKLEMGFSITIRRVLAYRGCLAYYPEKSPTRVQIKVANGH